MMSVSCQYQICRDPVNISGIRMLAVIAELIPDIHDNVQTAQGTGRQPEDIDKTKGAVLQQKPISRFEIAFKHEGGLFAICLQENAAFASIYQSADCDGRRRVDCPVSVRLLSISTSPLPAIARSDTGPRPSPAARSSAL